MSVTLLTLIKFMCDRLSFFSVPFSRIFSLTCVIFLRLFLIRLLKKRFRIRPQLQQKIGEKDVCAKNPKDRVIIQIREWSFCLRGCEKWKCEQFRKGQSDWNEERSIETIKDRGTPRKTREKNNRLTEYLYLYTVRIMKNQNKNAENS